MDSLSLSFMDTWFFLLIQTFLFLPLIIYEPKAFLAPLVYTGLCWAINKTIIEPAVEKALGKTNLQRLRS